LGGEIQETSKKSVLKAVNDQDVIQEVNLCLIQKKKESYSYISDLKNHPIDRIFSTSISILLMIDKIHHSLLLIQSIFLGRNPSGFL
jgi:hypothetical protein